MAHTDIGPHEKLLAAQGDFVVKYNRKLDEPMLRFAVVEAEEPHTSLGTAALPAEDVLGDELPTERWVPIVGPPTGSDGVPARLCVISMAKQMLEGTSLEAALLASGRTRAHLVSSVTSTPQPRKRVGVMFMGVADCPEYLNVRRLTLGLTASGDHPRFIDCFPSEEAPRLFSGFYLNVVRPCVRASVPHA
eukprot:GHVU01126591.1.p2 GENE.GHVU01126591.1~~GHVU01126591.1.p2  ORF type:complete len:204 (-),score=32.99 GHVU01126591.1:455-1027(-)